MGPIEHRSVKLVEEPPGIVGNSHIRPIDKGHHGGHGIELPANIIGSTLRTDLSVSVHRHYAPTATRAVAGHIDLALGLKQPGQIGSNILRPILRSSS